MNGIETKEAFRVPWYRLAASIPLTAALCVLVDELSFGTLSNLNDLATVPIALLFFTVVFCFVIPAFYFLSIAASQSGVPAWSVFPVMLVGTFAVFTFVGMSGNDWYQLGGKPLVIAHHVTEYSPTTRSVVLGMCSRWRECIRTFERPPGSQPTFNFRTFEQLYKLKVERQVERSMNSED